jgi:hypothetical protein
MLVSTYHQDRKGATGITFGCMKRSGLWWKLFTCLLLINAAAEVSGQKLVWDSLVLAEPPANWSKQTQADKLVLSNYNINGQPPLYASLLKGSATTGRPEIEFQKWWRSILQLPDSVATPRMKRIYGDDGQVIFTGSNDKTTSAGKAYQGLYLFWKATYVQAVFVEAQMVAGWREVLSAWEDVLRSADWLVLKK